MPGGANGRCKPIISAAATPQGPNEALSTTHVMPENQDYKEQIVDIKPFHVLLVGAGILGSGLILTASVSYKQAGKQLAAEGIDASIRRKVLPHAVKALTGSLLLTGLAAAGSFYALHSFGFVPARRRPAGQRWQSLGDGRAAAATTAAAAAAASTQPHAAAGQGALRWVVVESRGPLPGRCSSSGVHDAGQWCMVSLLTRSLSLPAQLVATWCHSLRVVVCTYHVSSTQ
ncbi:hypothetical protein COO60DRAFT_295863 [Scenedesmus sp. NREL 46B-D3]|nr:hypothetical protein COO60DRAFT_295863 [Scenedesmus sp. NREL 46B-D3]